VSKLPGINHLKAVAALEKAGFLILRQGAHIVMTDGSRILTIPAIIRSMPSRWPESCVMPG
jgi:predicted RNA binding protein YcfA (HicA-like mRNA interferase family)